MKKYPVGSEWRRWDLHIHTPETKKNDQFEGSTIEEKWERFYSDVETYIGEGDAPDRSISVVGITDYLSIDNFKKIINDKRFPETIELVLPNVEMRILPIASDSPVNIHFIFDPKIVDTLESRFFGKLEFEYSGSKFSATKEELIRLGKQLKEGVSAAEAYKLGVEQFIPSLDNIREIFTDEDLRKSTIIGVSNNSSDGVSGVVKHSSYFDNTTGTSQLTMVRQSVYQFVDFIFSSNDNDRNYFLGEAVDSKETVIKKCGSLKPCLHGSDAHCNNKIFEPDEKRYCWIKADPTFNGLRQVLYEPKDRVRICQLVPETKSAYHVITKVLIKDDDFQNTPIFFNDKLTCIVGGKSTGKSILLHNLANTIDRKQVEEKTEKAITKTKIVKSMEVHWADGTIDETGNQSKHKIVYIPQTYLNRLSDENEETTEIDKIIENIVLLDDETREAYNCMCNLIKNLKPKLDKSIYDVVNLQDEYNVLSAERKELGSKEGITKEIQKLKKQKDEQTKLLDLSEADIECYDKATKSIGELKLQHEKIENYIQEIEKIDEIVSLEIPKLNIIPEFDLEVNEAINKVKKAVKVEWENQKTLLITKLKDYLENTNKKLKENNQIKEELQDKINSNEALSQLTKKVLIEEKRLDKFIEIDKKCVNKQNEIDRYVDELANTFESYAKIYEEFSKVINERDKIDDEELKFSVSYPFRSNAFCESIKKLFDKRVLKSKRDCINLEDFNYADFNPEKLKSFIKMCLRAEIPIVKGINLEVVLRTLLSDWFNITYNVIMDGDKIEEMSPGKKALVLLRLLISLAESNSPILIDQPEDDLDNRSITDDLINFIKEKKITRQIIVVTHNANVVLGGDAEEIIVANQRGKNSPNNKYRFEYRSGAIEDETPLCDKDGKIKKGILNSQGIAQHICDILEGGVTAFDLRKNKYKI